MLATADLSSRLGFATSIARSAGARLLSLRESGRWEDPKILGNVGDQAADGYLQGAIFGRYPEDAILSEETKDDLARPVALVAEDSGVVLAMAAGAAFSAGPSCFVSRDSCRSSLRQAFA